MDLARSLSKSRSVIGEHIHYALHSDTDVDGPVLDAAKYSVIEGQKWRGLIGLMTYELLGGDAEKFMPSAVGIELVHAASLVTDDLPCMDGAETRRGRTSTWKEFDESTAILASHYLKDRGALLMRQNALDHGISNGSADNYIQQVLTRLYVGQATDLELEKSERALRQSMIDKSNLFQLALAFPAILLDSEHVDLLKDIGRDVTLAYQLMDDLRDLLPSDEVGKPTGVESEKGTSAYLYGREEVEQEIRDLRGYINSGLRTIQPDSDLELMINMILSRDL